MARIKITVSEKTKALFKPFFDVSSYKEKKKASKKKNIKDSLGCVLKVWEKEN